MVAARFGFAIFVIGMLLAACRSAEQPQVTHWYGTGSYTTGIYDAPESYRSPTN